MGAGRDNNNKKMTSSFTGRFEAYILCVERTHGFAGLGGSTRPQKKKIGKVRSKVRLSFFNIRFTSSNGISPPFKTFVNVPGFFFQGGWGYVFLLSFSAAVVFILDVIDVTPTSHLKKYISQPFTHS